MDMLIPIGKGNGRAIHPGKYHNPDNGFEENGYPEKIRSDQSGIC